MEMIRSLPAKVLDDLPRSVRSRTARHPAAGVRAGPAQIEFIDRSSIPGPAYQRPKCKKLIECLFAVHDMSATQSESLLQIQRRYDLTTNDQLLKIRRGFCQAIDYRIAKLLAPRIPIASF